MVGGKSLCDVKILEIKRYSCKYWVKTYWIGNNSIKENWIEWNNSKNQVKNYDKSKYKSKWIILVENASYKIKMKIEILDSIQKENLEKVKKKKK